MLIAVYPEENKLQINYWIVTQHQEKITLQLIPECEPNPRFKHQKNPKVNVSKVIERDSWQERDVYKYDVRKLTRLNVAATKYNYMW